MNIRALLLVLCTLGATVQSSNAAPAHHGERCFDSKTQIREVHKTEYYAWHWLKDAKKMCYFVPGDFLKSPATDVAAKKPTPQPKSLKIGNYSWSAQKRDSETARDFWDYGERTQYSAYDLDGRWLWPTITISQRENGGG